MVAAATPGRESRDWMGAGGFAEGGGKNGGRAGGVLARVKSLSDMVLGFFEEGDESPDVCWEELDDEEEEEACDPAERAFFWESQHQLLQAALSSSSSLEAKISRATENAQRKLRSEGAVCSCSGHAVARECRNCMLRAISDRLRSAGFDCALCKSKWRSSPDIPSGEHSYLDVVHKSTAAATTAGSKKGPVRVVIELNFRAEFEMARASHDYNALVGRLPEVLVGKPEKLKGVIKVMCAAAKRCMKDNKMHMAPWRKHKYMQAKWLSSSSARVARDPAAGVAAAADGEWVSPRQAHKAKASMLTFDLLEMLPTGLHCAVVEVV